MLVYEQDFGLYTRFLLNRDRAAVKKVVVAVNVKMRSASWSVGQRKISKQRLWRNETIVTLSLTYCSILPAVCVLFSISLNERLALYGIQANEVWGSAKLLLAARGQALLA